MEPDYQNPPPIDASREQLLVYIINLELQIDDLKRKLSTAQTQNYLYSQLMQE